MGTGESTRDSRHERYPKAISWCKEYGDGNHVSYHSFKDQKEYNLFCPNCQDGLSYAKDVVAAVMKRLTT